MHKFLSWVFINLRSACFGLFSPSSGATFFEAWRPDVPAYTNGHKASKNVASDDRLKSPKHVEHLMINKGSLLRICASSRSTAGFGGLGVPEFADSNPALAVGF